MSKKLTKYSSGHGTQTEDMDGDEQDGQDEGKLFLFAS